MYLTDNEKKMIAGNSGSVKAKALDYIVQFGDAFGAERLVDVSYCHYPAEMAIYDGFCEDVEAYASNQLQVVVPTSSSTLCCDLTDPQITGCPSTLIQTQMKTQIAFEKMGILPTFTCTPQQIGFVPLYRSPIVSVESSAIIYFNSILGARTNRGGLFTRYAAVTGKYPLMGYLLEENRKPNCFYRVDLSSHELKTEDQWSILGFLIGKTAEGKVPFIYSLPSAPTTSQAIIFGAAMATSGSVTLFHLQDITPEAYQFTPPKKSDIDYPLYRIDANDMKKARDEFMEILPGNSIDFVVLGCPHATLEDIRHVVSKINNRTLPASCSFWICTNRATKYHASKCGYVASLNKAGIKVVADTCPVESHMRSSVCSQYQIPYPCYQTMLSNSVKMLRYSRDLLGVKTAIQSMDSCIESAFKGKLQ